MKVFLWAVLLVVVVYIFLGISDGWSKDRPPEPYVIDGDSINYNGQDVRLWGIDAPEFKQTCTDAKGKSVPAGQLARDYLIRVIGGKPIQCRFKGRDSKYGRPLMTCTSFDGYDINKTMVDAGWAWAYVHFSLDYFDAERVAKSYKLGVHDLKCEFPWDYRKTHGNGGRPTPPLKPSTQEKQP